MDMRDERRSMQSPICSHWAASSLEDNESTAQYKTCWPPTDLETYRMHVKFIKARLQAVW